MTDLEDGVVILKQKQKIWRKDRQEGSIPNGLIVFKRTDSVLLNSGPLKGIILPSFLCTQKDLIGDVERVRE